MPVWAPWKVKRETAQNRLAARVARRMSTCLLPLIVQCVPTAFITLKGLDKGFIGQFANRVQQNPLILQVAVLSFALQLLAIAAWAACKRIGYIKANLEWLDPYCFFVGSAFAGAAARYALASLKVYVPLLSPFTLALTAWAVWPAYIVWSLINMFAGSDAAIIVAAFTVLVWPMPAIFAGKVIGDYMVGVMERSWLFAKKAKKAMDYVKLIVESPDPVKTYRRIQCDYEVAGVYNDEERRKTIRAAWDYIRKNRYDLWLRIINRYFEAEAEVVSPRDKVEQRHAEEERKPAEEERKVAENRPSQTTAVEQRPAEVQKAVNRELLEDLKNLRIFKGVVGLDDIKSEIVWRFLLPLFFPEEAEGIKPSGGILIYGPTGTGKTEVMRALLDTCRKLDIQVLECKPSDVMIPYVGATERKIKKLFETAREKQSIIFIDEADGLLGVRAYYEASWSHTVLKEFLEQMDGLKENEKLLIIACTNEPWRIAEPVLRPGRLGTHFYAPPPGMKERMELFKIFLKRIKVEGEIDYEMLAKLTGPSQRGYYCGADIKAICERAYMRAVRSGRKAATMSDLEAAVLEVCPSISEATVDAFERFAQKYVPTNQTPDLFYVK